MTDTERLYRQYWERFCEMLSERKSLVDYSPEHKYYLTHRFGAGIRLSPVASKGKRYISVELILEGGSAKEQYNGLDRQREAICRELGEGTEWQNRSDQKQSYIKLHRYGCDISDQNCWPDQHDWLFAKLQLFYAVFYHRVKDL